MSLLLPRRSFLLGLGAALAAPAIVRFESLMPVKGETLVVPETPWMTLGDDGGLLLSDELQAVVRTAVQSLTGTARFRLVDED